MLYRSSLTMPSAPKTGGIYRREVCCTVMVNSTRPNPLPNNFSIVGDYIRADGGTEIGRLMRGMDWGDASSNPALVHDSLCSA